MMKAIGKVGSLAAIALLVGGCTTPPSPPSPSNSSGSIAVLATRYVGPFYPAAIATDDGRTIVVAGGDVSQDIEPSPDTNFVAVVALSKDGGHSWNLVTLAAGRITGAAIRGTTIWLTAECTATRCLLASSDGGASWRELPVRAAVSPSLANPSSGVVLSPLEAGKPVPAWTTQDGGATFSSDMSMCGSERSPVSISLDASDGVVACRANGDPVVDYNDDWVLLERRADAWTPLYDPPAVSSAYDPNASPSLSVSWVSRVVRRAGWAILSGGAGSYRSPDNGHTWFQIEPHGSGLPQELWPRSETIAVDGTGFGLVTNLGGMWWVVQTRTQGATWTTISTFSP